MSSKKKEPVSFEARIIQLLDLEEGWHDGDGKAITDEAAKDAREFARALTKDERAALAVFPTPEGGIEIVSGDRNKKTYWEIEITPEGFVYDPDYNFNWESSIVCKRGEDFKTLYPETIEEAVKLYKGFFQE